MQVARHSLLAPSLDGGKQHAFFFVHVQIQFVFHEEDDFRKRGQLAASVSLLAA
jgi:hypothetical protein